jgi:hydrogenase expression/formation protein HypE
MSTDITQQQIVLAHGGGGELTRKLIAERLQPKLSNPYLDPLTDSAVLSIDTSRLAFTTDAYVVQPLEFPGGNIGRLAVCGTINDLAVAGALPKALSLAMVVEEGLPLATFDRIVDSVADAAAEAGTSIVTGDTKVIEHHGSGGLTITTAGLGEMRDNVDLSVRRIEPGDVILISGCIADHGFAIMSAREGLAFESELQSDVAPLNGLIDDLFACGADIRFLRDPTRGGLAGVLADLAQETGLSIEIDEQTIPISRVARHTGELLGLDPLVAANEGKCVAVVPATDEEKLLNACRAHALGRRGAIIGRFRETEPPLAELVTLIGGRRIIQRPYGEELPRIC